MKFHYKLKANVADKGIMGATSIYNLKETALSFLYYFPLCRWRLTFFYLSG